MYLRLAKRTAARNRQAAALEARLEHGRQGHALRPEAQAAAQARRVLSAVPLRLDHQQLQPPLPGLLGRCGRQAADDRAGGVPPADPRSQGDGQLFFGIVGGEPFMHPQLLDMLGQHPRLLLPGLHQRPVHHRRRGQAAAAARQRHAARSASRATRSSATSAAAARTSSARRCRACTTA